MTTTTLERARGVLASRDFRFLMASRLTSQFGDGLFQALLVASVVFSPEKQNTALGFAKAAAILLVPFSVLGPFAGVFIDRWPRRAILVTAPLLRAGFALLVLGGTSPAVPFYAGALAVLSANRFFLTTVGAVTPRLVPTGDLLTANSLATVGGTVATFVGLVVGGQMADHLGANSVLVPASVAWPLASFLASRIRGDLSPLRRATEPIRAHLGRVVRELREGGRRLLHTQRALAPVTSITVDQFLQGMVLVISVVVFKERFREGVGSFSWLVGAGGVGIFAGLLTIGPLAARVRRRTILAVAFAVSGVPLLLVAADLARLPILAASFLLGLSFAWKKIPVDTMTQEAIPDRYRGRVFSIYDVAYNMARVVAALLAIPLLDHLDVRTVIAACGVVFLLWIPVLWRWLARAATIKVRTYDGARADESIRSVEVGGQDEPVEVERSWREQRAGNDLLCFRLRLEDGTRIEISRPVDRSDRWRLDRELPT
jgi:MFS family permease